MSDAIKFKNNKYLDTSGSVHNGMILKTWLDNLNNNLNNYRPTVMKIIDDMNNSQINQIRANTDPLSARFFDYYNSAGAPTQYGNVMEMVGRATHWQAQLAIAGGTSNVYVRNKGYNTNTFTNWVRLAQASELPSDSGWVNVPLNTGLVSQYDSGNPALRCRKFGPVITVAGILKANYAFTPTGNTSHRLATLPSGYRPASVHNVVMQGSGSNRWMCSIRPDGNMYISRYSNNTTTNNQVPANAWLNILATYMV